MWVAGEALDQPLILALSQLLGVAKPGRYPSCRMLGVSRNGRNEAPLSIFSRVPTLFNNISGSCYFAWNCLLASKHCTIRNRLAQEREKHLVARSKWSQRCITKLAKYEFQAGTQIGELALENHVSGILLVAFALGCLGKNARSGPDHY